jgi:hypothetical protein
MDSKHPTWRAEVFTPKGDRAPYFVSLGGRMTLSEAERIQRDARAKGMPKDTFVRNFSNSAREGGGTAWRLGGSPGKTAAGRIAAPQ